VLVSFLTYNLNEIEHTKLREKKKRQHQKAFYSNLLVSLARNEGSERERKSGINERGWRILFYFQFEYSHLNGRGGIDLGGVRRRSLKIPFSRNEFSPFRL
jgi:hypothetical protein